VYSLRVVCVYFIRCLSVFWELFASCLEVG